MLSKKRYNKMVLTAVTVLLSALFISCASAKKAENNTEQTEEQNKDSVEQFIPTHPPVVIPHSWRGAME